MHVHDLLQLDSLDPGGCATGHDGRAESAGDIPHADGCPTTEALVALAAGGPAEGAALDAALRACGLSPSGPYRVVVATTVGEEHGPAVSALAEALRCSPGEPFAAGPLPGGAAVALVPVDPDAERRLSLGEPWPTLYAEGPQGPQTPLHAGISGPVRDPEGIDSALGQARYALAVSRAQAPDQARVTAVEDLGTLGALLAGVPAEVRTAFSSRVLGPLARGGGSHGMLVETLEVFLAHHGSWARTAAALQLHVNSVHYRIQRIESLTGRDLSRLEHKLDLQAALLCR
ncbi:CdaR family transcriptional regulator [Streptomyces sp. ID38640]|uniref:PucR family transcriptional regulator n=1 Tax=Streptomyces sp. ID38640 TaxID=1265399 RepID=UPI002180ACA4|nr:helix-turn-helix domain-containing protein [Streptomyces sp. ID38640]